MSESNKHKASTPEKFQDYLDGKLSAREQHEFEKKLMEDDFEAEAMEGMDTISQHALQDDLDELKARIAASNKKPTLSYWPVAAVITLLLTATISLFYFVDLNKKDNSTAQELKKEIEAPASSPENDHHVITDSAHAEAEVETQTALSIPPPQANQKKPDDLTVSSSDLIALAEKKTEESSGEIAEIPGSKLEIEPVKSRNTSGITATPAVKETQLEPVPETGSLNRVATSEVLPTEDKSLNEEGFEMPSIITYNEEIEEIPEYEPAESSSKMKASRSMKKVSQARDAQPAASSMLLEDSEVGETPIPYPETGMDEFILYVKNNLADIPQDSVLHLTLLISDNGKMIELATEENLNRKYFKELEQIIVDGPNWVPASINGITVEKHVKVKVQW